MEMMKTQNKAIAVTQAAKMKCNHPATFARRLSGFVAALLASCLSANADTTLFTSAFHGNSGATVLSGNADNTSGATSLTIKDWTNNAAVTSISGLTALSTTAGGFAVLQNGTAEYANTNCVFINNNLNVAPCQRGYSFIFTINSSFDLTTLTVAARHTSNTGNLAQQYTSDLHYSISGGTLGAPLAGYATETYPLAPQTNYTVVPFSLGNATVGAGTYTVQVYMTNLVGSGAYATYQGITLAGYPSATTFFLKTGDASGSSSFTTPLTGSASGWTNSANPTASAPATGNDYHVNVANLRSPTAAGTYIFSGNNLYLDAGGRFLGKPASTTPVICSANYVLNGGNCDPANASSDYNILQLAGAVTVNAASGLGAYGATSSGSTFETLDVTAPISGSAALQVSGSTLNSGGDSGVVRLSAANPYSGTITVTNANGGIVASAIGRILQLNNLNALSNATLNLTASVANPLSFSNAVNSGAFNIGALSGSSSQSLADTAGSPVTLSVGGNNASTTFSGGLSGTSGALMKIGSGTLTLAGTNTYTGNTTVSGGTLELAVSALATSSTVSVTSGAILKLDSVVTNQIAGLVLNGTSQSAGYYSSANASPYLTGSGYLFVQPANQAVLPTFSPLPGDYAAGQIVTISSATPGATIYYTTNGTTPTTASASGTTPVTVVLPANTIITIQAFALASGYTASSVVSATYSTYTNYTWINAAGGNWSTAANWSNNAVANGVGIPADFSELTLGGSATVTLNTPITVGSMTFGDQANANGWTLANGGAGPLTLNDGTNTPVIVVDNQTASISALLAGTNGLAITGSGTLVLTNANTFSGGTTVNGGTLALDYNVGDAVTGTLAGGNPVTVNASGTLRLDVEDALGYNGGIPSALNIEGGVVTSADVANTTSVQSGGTSFRVTLPTLNFYGGTLSSGVNNQGDNYGGSYLLNAVNTYSNTTTAVINAYSLSLQGSGTITVAAGNTPSGVDLDVSSQLRGWVGGNSALTKAGAGVMELDQNSTPYNNAVNVNAGTLILNGTLGNGAVAVAANAKFLAAGSLNGPISVSAGGTFGVGYTTLNTLASYSTLTFYSGSTNYMKISKNGGSAQSDQVQDLTSVTMAGTLVVTNITSDATPIASGDTFQLFPSAVNYYGSFSSVVLPPLPVGLGWDISQLASGIIMVSSSAAPPTFNPAPGGYAGALTVTISSLTPGATIYYTTDGSTPTTSSPYGITPVSVVLPANTNITVQAFALGAGYSASSVQSAAYSTYTNYTWVNPSGGSWSSMANWSNNAVANGVGTPADFSELTLSGSPTVTLDIPATVGSLIFGDQANANSWTLADGGAGPLKLNAGTNIPVIAVSNQTTTISAVLAGSSGLIKTGAGTLVLNNANVDSGPLVVNNGTVALNYNPGDGPTGTLAAGTTNTVDAGGTLLMNVQDVMGYGAGSTAQLNINGGLVTSADVANTTSVQNGGTSFRVTLPPVSFTGGTLSSGANNQGDNYGGSYLMSSVNTFSNSTTAVINAYKLSLVAGSSSVFNVAAGNTPSGVDLSVSSILINWGGNFNLTKNGNGVMTLSGANTYSGGTTVSGGTLNLANVNAPGVGGTALNINATANIELSTDTGFGGTNPVYNVTLGQIGPYVGTMILNRATAGANTGITHNFGALTLSLNYGAPTALNVLAGPNAPTGGAVDTLAFSSVNFGNWYSVTETIAPTNANIVIGSAAAETSQAGSTQVATLDLDGTSTGNQITGAIVDNGSGSGLNQAAILKSNSGKWTLSGINTYTGNTTINGGTLALAGSGSIANTPEVVIAGGATFDVSGLSAPFALGASQTLGNSGSTGVFVGNGNLSSGTVLLNFSSGTPALTVSNGTLTLSPSTVFQINNLGSQLPGGTYPLISTSAGGTLAGSVTSDSVIVGGGGAGSAATLAVSNGQLNLVVASTVSLTPTNIVSSVSGNTLNLSWPSDHLGWTLQTNSVGLTAVNQWFPYPGSTSVTNVSISIDATKTNVFFRMFHP
jgi:autotransporter-associated beta strand protein